MGEYMGRGALVLLLSTGSGIMKVVWVAVLVTLILVVQTEAKGKGKGKKPGKPKPTGKCPVDSTSTKQFEKFTVTKKVGGKTKPQADQACWWNASLNECAKCKPGGIQCGFPMHKWCQSKKSKVGCKGIPNYKYTLSAAGYPCYWDTKSLKCAWCAPKRGQCKDSAQAQKCGSYCEPATSLKCDGVLTLHPGNRLPTLTGMLKFQLIQRASSSFTQMVAKSSRMHKLMSLWLSSPCLFLTICAQSLTLGGK